MTPTPPSSSGHSPHDQDQLNSSQSHSNRIVRKRNRVPLSCGPCRNRKLKCNRAHPCENCVRRHDADSCTYTATPPSSSSRSARKQSSGSTSSGTGSSSDEMQSRIDRLEGLVLSLMGTNGDKVSPRDREDLERSSSSENGGRGGYEDDGASDVGMGRIDEEADHKSFGLEETEKEHEEDEVEEVRSALGVMKVHGGKSFYRGETHWAAILSEIVEVRNFFMETRQKYEERLAFMKAESKGCKLEQTGFPFSAGKPPTRTELLSLVPRQELVDVLVDGYFRNYDPIFHALHRPTFYQQYEEFWRAPEKVDVIWLGLLMAIMCLSLRIYHHSGEEPPELAGRTLEMSHAFKIATEQALVVGDFTRKHYLHTVQTLILLCTAQGTGDHTDTSWIFHGTVVRIALCMGLHRDPRGFKGQVSVSEGEIRKRLWTIISCMDILSSIQIGLPSMIRQEECDCGLPLNLHDDEIGDHVTTLPPERNRDELTGVSYMIAKARMARIYGRVVAQATSLGPRFTYDQVQKFDSEIRELYASTPTFLRLKPTEEAKNDPAWLIIQRYNLDLLTKKALVTLHRPYAARARTNPKYANSRQQCVEAAMVLLSHQAEIYMDEMSTLRHAKWFTESLGNHDFLHAAMIICLDLSTSKIAAREGGSTYSGNEWGLGSLEISEQFRALEKTRGIYEQQKEVSIESSKAFGILSVMLDKLRGGAGKFDPFTGLCVKDGLCSITKSPSSPTMNTPTLSCTNSTRTLPVGSLVDPLKSEQAAALTLGMMSGGGLTPNSAAGMMFDRAQTATPGGNNVVMNDVAGSIPSTGLVPTGGSGGFGVASPPLSSGPLTPFTVPGWLQGNVDMPNGLDWDEWDNFMQGINLEAPQTNVWSTAKTTTGLGSEFEGTSNNSTVPPLSPPSPATTAQQNSAAGNGLYRDDGMDIGSLLR